MTGKKTILYVAPEITLPDVHGGSSHVEGVVQSFVQLGYHVLLLSKWSSGLGFFEKRKDLSIVRFPVTNMGLLKNILYFFYITFFTPFILLFSSTDVVYERSRPFGGMAILFARLFRKKSVYELNEPLDFAFSSIPILQNMAVPFGRFVAKQATIITGTHPCFFKELPKKKCLRVDYGVDPSRFNPQVSITGVLKKYGLKNKRVILYNGSFAPWHALESVVYAARDVVKKEKNVVFLLIGSGKKYDDVKRLVYKLNLEKYVILPGNILYSKMPQFVNTATIALDLFDRDYSHFKKYDFFYSPIKLHEHKACGKPIIASNFGNLKRYVVHGKNGFLVNESKVSEISSAILKLLRNKKKLKEIGVQNRKEVLTTYNWDAVNLHVLKALKI